MAEFSKGKWTDDDMGTYVFAHGYDMMICKIRGWGYLKNSGLSDDEAIEVQKANARLIAAAPELYELLNSMCSYINEIEHIIPHFPDALSLFAKYGKELLTRIDGKEINNVPQA